MIELTVQVIITYYVTVHRKRVYFGEIVFSTPGDPYHVLNIIEKSFWPVVMSKIVISCLLPHIQEVAKNQ